MGLVAREAITPTNQSPVFVITTWILQAAVLLAVAVKVLLLHTSVGLHADDWCMIVAAILSIGQVVAVSFQGINGIGKVQSLLSHDQLITYQKAGYAGEILYTLSLETSKLAVVLFIYQITPFAPYRRVAVGLGIFIVVWSIAALFVTAFQCSGPTEWAFVQGQCIDQTAFWTAYAVINIATELVLIIVPFEMFYTLISSLSKKIILMFCFSLRLAVIAGATMQIYFLHHPVHPPIYSPERDITFSTWPLFLCTQIVQCLSIITACIPFMRSLFEGLETGMIQTGHVTRRNLSTSGRWTSRTGSSGRKASYDPPCGDLFRNDGSDLFNDSSTPRSMSQTSGSLRRDSSSSPHTSSGALNSRRLSSVGQDRQYSRREVSMIVEEEEEEARSVRMHRSIQIQIPEDVHFRPSLDVDIPSSRMSLRYSSGHG